MQSGHRHLWCDPFVDLNLHPQDSKYFSQHFVLMGLYPPIKLQQVVH